MPKTPEEINSFYEKAFSELEVSDLSFSYTGEYILKHINLTLPKQSFTAITGRTGSGKSTLFKLLLCLYHNAEGGIHLCTESGTRIPIDASWRSLFAYVPQGNQLMSGSIREIVTFGNEEDMKKEEEIYEALDMACAREFTDRMPEGIDTKIGENGVGLSEGQMQRIAIARAFFSRRPFLLLDEATSALDETTERSILLQIKEMSDRTVLVVTHRPAALQVCSQEIHVENNNVTVRSLPA